MFRKLFFMMTLVFVSLSAFAQQKITFPSKDGITITADWYPVENNAPVILLCHQAQFSRGEYNETAPRLNKLGFNCLAIDQRSGDEVNGVKNITAYEAKSHGKPTEYEDAERDILASLDFLKKKFDCKIILWGSSYSASLALKIAKTNENISAVIVFSPGEYFKTTNYVRSRISGLDKPIFITSSKEESEAVTDLVKDVISKLKVQYIPKSAGIHGAKALWTETPDNQEYWIALMSFLAKVKTL